MQGADLVRDRYLQQVLDRVNKAQRKKEKKRRKLLKEARNELKKTEEHERLMKELYRIEIEAERKIRKTMAQIERNMCLESDKQRLLTDSD